MRPEAPARYRRSLVERLSGALRPPLVARMVLRNFERQPTRAFISVLGMAFAVAVLFVGLAFIDVMNVLMDVQFTRVMRQDATIALIEPRGGRALYDARHLPGAMEIEPMRIVPVRLRAGVRSRAVAITGLLEAPQLNRVVDRDGRQVALPPEGLVM